MNLRIGDSSFSRARYGLNVVLNEPRRGDSGAGMKLPYSQWYLICSGFTDKGEAIAERT